MTDADVHEITRAPWITVGSDGNALAVTGVTSQGKPHPRYYGTHAFVLVDSRSGYTPTPAVSRAILAHNSAGRGPQADGIVAVFDAARIINRSTYENPSVRDRSPRWWSTASRGRRRRPHGRASGGCFGARQLPDVRLRRDVVPSRTGGDLGLLGVSGPASAAAQASATSRLALSSQGTSPSRISSRSPVTRRTS
jgi:hypothetical protein